MKSIWLEESEIRLHADGTVDEIVIRDARGNCLFHLEQMSDQHYWMAVYPRSKKLEAAHINIGSKRGRADVEGVLTDQGSAAENPVADAKRHADFLRVAAEMEKDRSDAGGASGE